MENADFCYVVRIQFLGFRYSGWQKQPGQKTVEGMLEKTLKFVLPDQKFKLLGAGRTDAKVSALDYAFELFLKETDRGIPVGFIDLFNKNLPPDIRATDVTKVTKEFNIIQHSKRKEYVYLFSCGGKNHPFCAPYMANVPEPLDIGEMKKAARLFEGSHDFSTYTARIRKSAKFLRRVDSCRITENTLLTANFFPKVSYALHISAEGFMRYQVRMIMGALIQLGRGALNRSDIEASLQEGSTVQMEYVAPGSGLLLNHLEFDQRQDSLIKD